ncbi:hypothetical protein BLNAU_22756 [Blattamonas nauphoetae]|uniref:Integrase catalytic domain-containing protein n=1 Tax=Blattamonas nauphoetae TaxID=2049346 RepID=A0ABQ9WS67_9EUKA|nr:hypothetical protein BLNAU_22756 [Blattamonas nauphoetae]
MPQPQRKWVFVDSLEGQTILQKLRSFPFPFNFSITDDDENTSLIGEFQLFEFHRLIFETRYSLFKQFNLQFPGLISKTFFYNHTTTLSQPRNRTDLCDLCETAETIQFDDRKGTEKTPEQLAEDEKLLEEWNYHVHKYHTQRRLHNKHKASLQNKQAVVIADYKQNLFLPLSRRQRNHSFFQRHPVIVFGVVVHLCDGDGKRNKLFFTFLSANNNKQSFDVICALRTVFWHPSMKDINSVQFWADGGSNFKCSETIHALTVLFPRRRLEQAGTQLTVVVNYFETAHGKNEVDSLFGVLSQMLKQNIPKMGLSSFSDLLSFFRQNTLRLDEQKPEHLRHHYVLEYDRAQECIDPCNLTIKGIKASLKFEVINGLLYTSQTSASFEPKTVSLWSKRNDTSQTRLQDTSISTVKTQVSSGFAESVAHEIESIEGKLPHVYSEICPVKRSKSTSCQSNQDHESALAIRVRQSTMLAGRGQTRIVYDDCDSKRKLRSDRRRELRVAKLINLTEDFEESELEVSRKKSVGREWRKDEKSAQRSEMEGKS